MDTLPAHHAMHKHTHWREKEDVARVREIIQVRRLICNANVDNPSLAKPVQSGDFFLQQQTFGWNVHADQGRPGIESKAVLMYVQI